MAAIPTVIYVGDDQINGGVYNSSRAPAGLRGGGLLGGLYGIYQANYKFARVVPSGADGVTGGTFNPYWDGSTVPGPSGAWVKFHYAPLSSGVGHVVSNGDNWMEPIGGADQAGTITPTPMLMNKLWERWPGGFKLIKTTNGAGLAGASGLANGGMISLVTVVGNAAAALTPGDTLDIKAVVIDGVMTDLADFVNTAATFSADVTTVVTTIRAQLDGIANVTCDAATPLVLVSPHPDASPAIGVVRALTIQYRNWLLGVQAANDNVHIFDMSWAKGWLNGITTIPGVTNQPGVYTPDGSRRYYSTDDYVEAGLRIGNFLDGVWAEIPSAPPGSAIPVVAMIGDSQFVGVVSNLFVELTRQPSLLGNTPNTTVRDGQYVWNAANSNIEPYDVLANANTYGTVNQATFGPEATLLKKLGERFPNGVVIWKYARNGVALTVETNGTANGVENAGDIWPDLLEQWALFKQECLNQLGRSPDLIGIVTDIGGNDASSTTASNAFVTKVPQWIDDLRNSFSTRAIGSPVPIVYLQPPPPISAGGNSIHNSSPTETMTARVGAVRNAIAALAASKPRLSVILNPGTTKYELVRSYPGTPGSEPVHYGGEAMLQIGYDLYDELVALLESDAGGDGATTGGGVDESAGVDGPPSEAAVFEVETGTGSAIANSYTTVEYATAYHETYGNPSNWTAADLPTQQDALRQATLALDLRYGNRWSGYRYSSAQALDWPRTYAVDSAGNEIESDTIPVRLQQATAMLALLHIIGEDINPLTRTSADIRSESLSAASGASKSVTYAGSKPVEAQLVRIDRMLQTAGLIGGGGGWGWLDV